jgi:hypothetical protein
LGKRFGPPEAVSSKTPASPKIFSVAGASGRFGFFFFFYGK